MGRDGTIEHPKGNGSNRDQTDLNPRTDSTMAVVRAGSIMTS